MQCMLEFHTSNTGGSAPILIPKTLRCTPIIFCCVMRGGLLHLRMLLDKLYAMRRG